MNIHAAFDQSARIAARTRDPTGLGDVRQAFMADGERRYAQVKVLIRQALIEQDIFGIGRQSALTLMATGGDDGRKIAMFSDWLHAVQTSLLLRDAGEWMRPYIVAAYRGGQRDALTLLGSQQAPSNDGADTFWELATTELHGIMDALDQRGARAFAAGVMQKRTPRQMVADILERLQDIAVVRMRGLIASIMTAAHAEASLDVFEAAGKAHVTLIPETIPRPRFGDAVRRLSRREGETQQEYEVRRDKTQASRLLKRTKAEGGATGRALKKPYNKTVKGGQALVVLTAGEDADPPVCPICVALAMRQYSIAEARGVLPAHNHCRCIWVTSDYAEEFE